MFTQIVRFIIVYFSIINVIFLFFKNFLFILTICLKLFFFSYYKKDENATRYRKRY